MQCILAPFVLPLMLAGINPSSEAMVDFNREIRPLLVEHCLACHGPDEKARKADLRLDRLNLTSLQTDGGKLITPGKPEESDLIARLVHTEHGKLMPPPKFAKPLNAKQNRPLQKLDPPRRQNLRSLVFCASPSATCSLGKRPRLAPQSYRQFHLGKA